MKPVNPAVRAYMSELGKRGGTAAAVALGVDGRKARAARALAVRWAGHVSKRKPKRAI